MYVVKKHASVIERAANPIGFTQASMGIVPASYQLMGMNTLCF